MSVTTLPSRRIAQRQPGWLVRLFDYKPFLIVVCLAPAIGLLAVFLTYLLGVMLFGRDRVPAWLHTLSSLLVAIGTSASAFWILALNSWMQTPQGYEII